MPDIVLNIDHVWKKFRRGERGHDSLRDLIPSAARNLFRRRRPAGLRDQEFWALKDVSFRVAKGEALGIIGPNGAGKSTALKLLSGILRPDRGAIEVSGRLSALIEIGAGFHPDLTGRENIYLNGAILGMTRKEMDRKLEEIVAFSELKDFLDTPVKRYSSGMYARLGFSVAAHVDPDILLVDEVLSVGDWAFQRKCLERMESFVKKGITIIFISHNLQAVMNLCPRALLLRGGSVIDIGPTGRVIRRYLTEAASAIPGEGRERTAWIGKVSVSDSVGRDADAFEAGERISVLIEVQANAPEDELAVTLDVQDGNNVSAFNTSSERLGHGTFAMEAGGVRTFRFEATLHLVEGHYYLRVELKKYRTGRIYDAVFPAAAFFVRSGKGIKGFANLYPEFREETSRRRLRAL
jgi:lipopolysaccharide transport system ATP-binding protein